MVPNAAGNRILALLFLPALAFGQTPDDKDKVSNDNPARPLQMPPASSEVKEAFDDFERFQRRGAWERALKALYTIPETQALRFVDGENGFIIPVAQQAPAVLAALPPEGQAAYRLFYDAEAKKLLDEADGPSRAEERSSGSTRPISPRPSATTRPIAWATSTSSSAGSTARPTAGWRSSASAPTPTSRPALISVKAALALLRAGRRGRIRADPGRAGGSLRRREGHSAARRPRPPSCSVA